ncbi:MAG TPA: anti-sigma factor [Chlorobaculum parvum]|uniref:Anti-sigma factor n=1 Tax=Chlorobaculum parvum TaxID=274539 RepID=A0A7C5HBQ8_9CHLB|nr:anti-sigma factor [Chlorobaculum parvum]
MNCNKAKVLMSAAIDGELIRKEELELTRHLDDCPECQAYFQEAKNTKVIIKERIVRVKAPQNLVESIVRMTKITST